MARLALLLFGLFVGWFVVLWATQACATEVATASSAAATVAASPPASASPSSASLAADATSEPMYARLVKVMTYGEPYSTAAPSKTDAAVALGLLGDERAVRLLVEHLENSTNPLLRRQIVKSLSWIGGAEAVAGLERVLQDKDPHLRQAASRALKHATGNDYEFDRTGLRDSSKMLEALRAAREDAK